ncbi:MAG: FtsX-like permease family protein [Bacteroides sp.]|nr:FtsX-like permease family protein [Eubacterium sp.]MCM1417734.1 FtsX-like permease family protein [Roseburia sp.]MCM1461375.1 FtsX-like permease family protein [Bacteroides sp.]
MRSGGDKMLIGIKDIAKLFAIAVVTCCAVFVCALFLNYNIDIAAIGDEIVSEQGLILYEAQVATGKVVAGVSGGSLVATTAVLLIFYIKNYIDVHGKELGILKALGYSNLNIARRFWVFGISVLVGTVVGYTAAALYMPTFYDVQNDSGLFPDMTPTLNIPLALSLIVLPTLTFTLLAILYAFFTLKRPVLDLLREARDAKVKTGKPDKTDLSFLAGLKKSTLGSRKILVFFVGFSAFCFSAMTQMAMSMDELSSETFSFMILSIGLILAFMTLLMSLTSVVKANTKTIAMMKVFGYSRKECGRSILGGYRPVSYIGFALGTTYQYLLLKIVVSLFFADFEDIPEFHFSFKALAISLAAFLAAYEIILAVYSRRIGGQSIKSIMLE